jgi:hypothetical protein
MCSCMYATAQCCAGGHTAAGCISTAVCTCCPVITVPHSVSATGGYAALLHSALSSQPHIAPFAEVHCRQGPRQHKQHHQFKVQHVQAPNPSPPCLWKVNLPWTRLVAAAACSCSCTGCVTWLRCCRSACFAGRRAAAGDVQWRTFLFDPPTNVKGHLKCSRKQMRNVRREQ